MIKADRARIEAASLSDDALACDGAFTVTHTMASGSSGTPDIPLVVCRPTATTAPHGVILHIHGGGMVAGTHHSVEIIGDLERAEALGLAVVGVGYRLAPEHPHPAPVEDCYTALRWVTAQSVELGFPAGQVVVSGPSAGGGLAAGLALLARDRHGPPILGQMLICPMLDDSCDSASSRQFDGRGIWDRTSNITGWDALLGDQRRTAPTSPYAAALRASDLTGLPPAYIDVGSAEALRDEAVAYADRIWSAGGRAELHVWSGAFHSFDEWVPQATISRTAKRARLDWLRRLLAEGRQG
jgi:acetyl esterase/lipase